MKIYTNKQYPNAFPFTEEYNWMSAPVIIGLETSSITTGFYSYKDKQWFFYNEPDDVPHKVTPDGDTVLNDFIWMYKPLELYIDSKGVDINPIKWLNGNKDFFDIHPKMYYLHEEDMWLYMDVKLPDALAWHLITTNTIVNMGEMKHQGCHSTMYLIKY